MNDADVVLEALRKLHGQLDQEMAALWNRRLPLNELLGDRWQRAARLGFGTGTSIYDSSLVFGDVTVGRNTWIGPFTILDGSGGLTIGDYCSVSSGVQIYTHDTVKWAVSGGRMPYERMPVEVGNCCYIGSQTVVSKGVKIGEHSVVGACSFVNKSVPPWAIAVGSPCRLIGRVELHDGEVHLVYDIPKQVAS